jgi:hypothetical protein
VGIINVVYSKVNVIEIIRSHNVHHIQQDVRDELLGKPDLGVPEDAYINADVSFQFSECFRFAFSMFFVCLLSLVSLNSLRAVHLSC